MSGFAHNLVSGTTTLSEIARVRVAISADQFFGCFAYATQSGFRVFELSVGKDFWTTKSRWLFGIDYGRTDPRALREIADRANTEVRIFDGRYVVDRTGFVPRRDFHPKVAMMENTACNKQGVVLGSGNFSYNGLRRSIEAGSATIATTKADFNEHIKPVRSVFEKLWKYACPLDDIAKNYEKRLADLLNSRDSKRSFKAKSPTRGFWIEAGYVTKNRGKDKPGNQIFAPNGFRSFFGLKKGKSSSTQIGEITFETETGPRVTQNYRENDNGMEKLTLPKPEDHGFGVYDGKVLIFKPRGKRFLLTAVERDDFELVYGHQLANVRKMTGGRRFGELT
ncbi:MAG: hypothetical protein K2Y40_11555 [Reyranella sp.]|jgi:HKD family nuclease|nr:hypothetical protein [Reyranella sp.]